MITEIESYCPRFLKGVFEHATEFFEIIEKNNFLKAPFSAHRETNSSVSLLFIYNLF